MRETAMLKGIGEAIREVQDDLLAHIEKRVASLAAAAKTVEEQERQRAFWIADELDAALAVYLQEPISYKRFGRTRHPLFTSREQLHEIIAPVELTTVSPSWINAFLGGNAG